VYSQKSSLIIPFVIDDASASAPSAAAFLEMPPEEIQALVELLTQVKGMRGASSNSRFRE
jgi:hypothetical protein